MVQLKERSRRHRSVSVSEPGSVESRETRIYSSRNSVLAGNSNSDSKSSSHVASRTANRFIDFEELISGSGVSSEEEFVLALYNNELCSVRIVGGSNTSDMDADFVFNNVSIRIVRSTGGLLESMAPEQQGGG